MFIPQSFGYIVATLELPKLPGTGVLQYASKDTAVQNPSCVESALKVRPKIQNRIKYWLKTSALVLLVISFSLGFSVWTPPSQASLIAALPPGNAIKDPNTLLRSALPIDNQSIREAQAHLEDISNQLGSKQWGKINGNISKASRTLSDHKSEILASVPQERKAQGETLMKSTEASLGPLRAAAEARNMERLIQAKAKTLDLIGQLEESMVQEFPFEVPAKYSNLPQLKGRATVEMETSHGPIKFVVDGYSAPVTAGNFVDLVQRGFYDGLEFTRVEKFYVVQAGDPPGPENNFVDPATGKPRTIPLEILAQNDSKPTYGITLEDAGRYQDKPVLPFSAYGTVAMARPAEDPNGGSSQFFFFLYEPGLVPAGFNLLDGRYAAFGYVTEGKETLTKLKLGDKIESAKVIQGAEHLVQAQA